MVAEDLLDCVALWPLNSRVAQVWRKVWKPTEDETLPFEAVASQSPATAAPRIRAGART